jgi:transcriptional regulator with GAF, ATPase, and Fis domain
MNERAAASALVDGADSQSLRARLDELLFALSHGFIDLPAEEISRGIEDGLGRIAELCGFLRGDVMQFSDDQASFSFTHRHSRAGASNGIPLGIERPTSTFAWSLAQLIARKPVQLDRDNLPPDAAAERAAMQLAGSRHIMSVPLSVAGRVIGAVGFQTKESIDPTLFRALCQAGEVFASALDRRRADDALRERMRFEEMLLALSTRFINTPVDELNAIIAAALAEIGEALAFDRVAVFELAGRRSHFALRHEWCAEDVETFSRSMTGMSVDEFGWPLTELREGRSVIFGADDMPADAPAARRVLSRDGTQLLVTIPLVVDGSVVGCMGFHKIRSALRPTEHELVGLRLLGEIVANALARHRAEQMRQQAFEEIARLKVRAEGERDYLREEIRSDGRLDTFVGSSPAIRRVLDLVDDVASTSAIVLICGESGVGKELVARAIHARSRRADGPLVKVNCASIPKELFESEFFGHVRGAFTGAHRDRVGRFELADRGTLFLDEVGEIPIELQAKLLRVLQEGELERVGDDRTRRVDVRVIAATNRNLSEEVNAGHFRADLFYRLSVFPVEVPPLRARAEDVLPLAEHFLRLHGRALGRSGLEIGPAQRGLLMAYNWPGNVRELSHVIERAVILSRQAPLRLELALNATEAPAVAPANGLYTEAQLRELERNNLIVALERASWRIAGPSGAAALLGISPSTLRDRMCSLDVRRPVQGAA